MSLFQCTACGCVENTALCNYWQRLSAQQPWLCSACDPEIQEWHGQFPQASAVGWWVDTAKHLWKVPEQAPSHYIIVGQITDEADAQTLRTRWKAQHPEGPHA